jgi:hypothetical protein
MVKKLVGVDLPLLKASPSSMVKMKHLLPGKEKQVKILRAV